MTALDSWMTQHNKPNGWLVELLGVSESQASRLRNGHSRPSLGGAAKLTAATGIPVDEFDLVKGDADEQQPEAAGAG